MNTFTEMRVYLIKGKMGETRDYYHGSSEMRALEELGVRRKVLIGVLKND